MSFENKYLKYYNKYRALRDTLKIGGGRNNNDECILCGEEEPMNAPVNSDDHVELECGHVFHYQCILNLIDATYTPIDHIKCPICNMKIDSIYNVTADLSNIPTEGEKVRRLAIAHGAQRPRIDLNRWEEYKRSPEYIRKRLPFLENQEENETPADKRRKDKDIWEETFFKKEDIRVLLMDEVDIANLFELTQSRIPILNRLVTAFELEKKMLNLMEILEQIPPNSRERQDFNRRYDEFKERLFEINPTSDPLVDERNILLYEQYFNEEFRHINRNYNVYRLIHEEERQEAIRYREEQEREREQRDPYRQERERLERERLERERLERERQERERLERERLERERLERERLERERQERERQERERQERERQERERQERERLERERLERERRVRPLQEIQDQIDETIEVLNSDVFDKDSMVTYLFTINLIELTRGNYRDIYDNINNPTGIEALENYIGLVSQKKYFTTDK